MWVPVLAVLLVGFAGASDWALHRHVAVVMHVLAVRALQCCDSGCTGVA